MPWGAPHERWFGRCRVHRAIAPHARDLLRVVAVWHDSGADLAAQRFVLWVSRLAEAGHALDAYEGTLRAALGAISATDLDHGAPGA